MGFTKITSSDTTGKGVVGLADTPNLSTTEMQQKFDELATDVIIPKFNNLVDELDAKDIDKRVESDAITNIALNEDDNIIVSTDGGTTYKQTASSGHIIMDGTGRSFTQRSRMQFSANAVISDVSADNTTFIQIPSGTKGDKGDAATIQVGTVVSGQTPSITNVGSQYDAIFDFTLPKGADGNAATIQVGTVTSGANASVSNRGTSSAAILDFVLPKGDKGDNGTSFRVLGMYATYNDLIAAHPTGSRGDAYAVGDATTNVIYNWNSDTSTWDNLGGLKGVKGDDGSAATVTVGTVTSGSTASVINSGTTTNAILDFVLEKGDKGDTGTSATISVGTVAKGDNVSITNSGTSTNAVFDFVIPKGDKGDAGAPSIVNGKSGDSIVLYGYDLYLKNYTKPSQYTDITNDDSLQSAIGKLEARNSGGSKIIVQTDSDSIGNTFTVSNGVKTLTQVADSTMKMEFFVDDIGTWTVKNVQADNSTTVNITCFSVYNVTLGVGNVNITVNYDADYVGYTFTLTNGTKTVTKTATSSLSLGFVVADLGTWTVSNSYDSTTKTVNVTAEGSYSVTFNIFTGLDITEWLSKGGITQTFSTLADILADQKTVRTLMTKHDAVDYLVDNESDTDSLTTILNSYYSIKWINLRDYALDKLSDVASIKAIMDTVGYYGYGEVTKVDGNITLKGLVPTMTSNSAPYGECSASGYCQSKDIYAPYRAFISTDSNGWLGEIGSSNAWVQYKFTNPSCVRKIELKSSYGVSGTNYSATISASNDNFASDTHNLGTITFAKGETKTLKFENDNYYLYYRVTIQGTVDSTNSGIRLQFYGRQLSVSVPTMTSNSEPWGEVIASRIYNAYDKYKAFDGNDSTSWATGDKNPNDWIGYRFKSDVCAKVCKMYLGATIRVGTYVVQGSNDNFASDIHDLTDTLTPTKTTEVITLNNSASYKDYRVLVKTCVDNLNIATLQFYGLDYSEHTERHWIYDHGVELETLDINSIGSGGTTLVDKVTKLDSQFEMRSNSGELCTLNTNSAINLSAYNLMRIKRGNYCASNYNTRAGQICILSSKSVSTSVSSIDFAVGISETYLDTSSVNTEVYMSINCTNNRNDSVNEWWLE